MNRWILRGVTVAGFTAGAWLLGNAAAYAADTSTDTTTTVTVEVHLGTLGPSTARNLTTTVGAPAVRLTVSTPVSTVVRARPAVHVHTALAATTSTTTPLATDVGLGACIDVAVDTAGTGCGQPTGTASDPAMADAATPTIAGIGIGSDSSSTVTDTATIGGSGSVGDPMVVRSPGITGVTGSTESAGPDAVPASDNAATAAPAEVAGALVSTGTGPLNGARSSVSGLAGTLPTTGSDLWWPLGIAAALLLLGTALRRRAT